MLIGVVIVVLKTLIAVVVLSLDVVYCRRCCPQMLIAVVVIVVLKTLITLVSVFSII